MIIRTRDVYRIHGHCCRVLSLCILYLDFMLVDVTTMLEKFLVGEFKTQWKHRV